MLELMKFLNKGLNSMEDGINKKLEIEYNNSINSKLQKSQSKLVNEGILWYDVYTGYTALKNESVSRKSVDKKVVDIAKKRRMSLLTSDEML